MRGQARLCTAAPTIRRSEHKDDVISMRRRRRTSVSAGCYARNCCRRTVVSPSRCGRQPHAPLITGNPRATGTMMANGQRTREVQSQRGALQSPRAGTTVLCLVRGQAGRVLSRACHLIPKVTDEWVQRLLWRNGLTAQRVRSLTSSDPAFDRQKKGHGRTSKLTIRDIKLGPHKAHRNRWCEPIGWQAHIPHHAGRR